MDSPSKPHEIKERVFVFACDVLRAFPRIRLDSASHRGALREMRESNYWLRLLIATELQNFRQVAPLRDESRELVAILSTIVRRTYENGKEKKRRE
jgi:hypothetical protein